MNTYLKEIPVCEQIIINGGQVQEGAFYTLGKFFGHVSNAIKSIDQSHVMNRRAV